jgi:hypothetical protein
MSMRRTLHVLIRCAVLCCATFAAQAVTLDELAKRYAGRLVPMLYLEARNTRSMNRFGDCSTVTPTPEQLDHPSEQRIRDTDFRWVQLSNGDEVCLFLLAPERRGLTREEAQVLLSAMILGFKEFNPAAKDDQYAAQLAARDSFGDDDAYEAGTINGYVYVIEYKGIGPPLMPLYRAQREYLERQKDRLRKLPYRDPAKARPAFQALDINCGGSKTFELASLSCGAGFYVDGIPSPGRMEWIVHIPSGRFLSFDDLFVDPLAARSRVSESAKGGVSWHFENMLFPDSSAEEEREYRAGYAHAWAAAITPVPEHFKNVTIMIEDNPERVYLRVEFPSKEIVPYGDLAITEFEVDKLRDLLKPEFQNAFDVKPLAIPNR